MKRPVIRFFITSSLFFSCVTHAQDPLTMGFGDIAAIRQKAEAGDAVAQVALADSLASRFHATEALDWYRKSAAQGNVEANYHVGHMLLFGAFGNPKNLGVGPNPSEGIRWTFTAATNFHVNACLDMAKALRQGCGTSTNLIAAYAWLNLIANRGSIVGRVEMNQLAFQLDTAAVEKARSLVAQFEAGLWQAPVVRAIAEGDPRLKLTAITLGTQPTLASINGKTFSEGESATVTLKPGTLRIKCLKIERNSVLILIEGEDSPRLLRLK